MGFILLLGVGIGSHLGDPRLLRNLSEEIFVAGIVFLLILNGFRCPLGSHFGNILETIFLFWGVKLRVGLGSYVQEVFHGNVAFLGKPHVLKA